ncbi:MAG TPA: hypothetical protein VJX94_18205 [Stellaceae bacterium]|nr:hypothetical protein [Stellaceae bacterium]
MSGIRSPMKHARDLIVADDREVQTRPSIADALARPSIAELHRRCIVLEDERRGLAVEIDERRIGDPAGHRRLIEREREVMREIGAILARIRAAPVQSIEDIAVLLDLALDIELDAPPPDLIMQDRPWTLLLVRGLRSLAPGVEMSWLRRQSPPGFDLEAELFTAAGTDNREAARTSRQSRPERAPSANGGR